MSRDVVLLAATILLVLAVAYHAAASSAGAPAPCRAGFSPAPASASASAGASAPPSAPGAARGGPAPAQPDAIAAAEREAWFEEGADSDPQAPAPGHDHDFAAYTLGLVADARMLENQKRWVEEMKPWAGTARRVDDMAEALEASTHFLGLRRPQAVAVPGYGLQVTEQDSATFAANPAFNFRG